jgi:hypothetical protein
MTSCSRMRPLRSTRHLRLAEPTTSSSAREHAPVPHPHRGRGASFGRVVTDVRGVVCRVEAGAGSDALGVRMSCCPALEIGAEPLPHEVVDEPQPSLLSV